MLAAHMDLAKTVLRDPWRRRNRVQWSRGVPLQIAGNLGMSLLELGRAGDLDAFLREVGPLADQAEREWGEAAGPVVFELPEATLVLPPGWEAGVDEHGTIIARFLTDAYGPKGTTG